MRASTTGALERSWLARRLGAVRRRWEATSFALRLFLSLGLALVLVGVFAYAEISRRAGDVARCCAVMRSRCSARRSTVRDAGAPASIGVAALRGGESPSELRAEADAALYEVKRGGAVHFDAIRSDTAVTTADRRNAVVRLIEEGGVTTVFQPRSRTRSPQAPSAHEV